MKSAYRYKDFADLKDIAQGIDSVTKLAQQNPDKAITNAECAHFLDAILFAMCPKRYHSLVCSSYALL